MALTTNKCFQPTHATARLNESRSFAAEAPDVRQTGRPSVSADQKPGDPIAVWMAVGIAIGAALGAVTHNISVGVGIGLVLGIAVGAAIKKQGGE